MNSYVKKVDNFKVDIERFRIETAKFLQQHPLHKEKNQVCLTHRENSLDPYYEATGALYDFDQKVFYFKEGDMRIFHEAWRSSYLYDVYIQLREIIPYPIFRLRFMKLMPISCLSLHHDPTMRLHIPIETNENCLFIFKNQIPVHLPADGSAYIVDTRQIHTVLNGDRKASRLHFVAAVQK